MLRFAGQNVSWKMDGEACPAGGSWTVSAVPGSLTDSSGVVFADVLARSSNVFSNSLSLCRSHCNGCVKVPWCRGCVRNAIYCLLQLDTVNCTGVAASRLP